MCFGVRRHRKKVGNGRCEQVLEVLEAVILCCSHILLPHFITSTLHRRLRKDALRRCVPGRTVGIPLFPEDELSISCNTLVTTSLTTTDAGDSLPDTAVPSCDCHPSSPHRTLQYSDLPVHGVEHQGWTPIFPSACLWSTKASPGRTSTMSWT